MNALPQPRPSRMAWLVAIIALLAWSPALRWAFVWDDDIVLLSNPHFNPPSWDSFLYYWAHPFWNLYTPLVATVYATLTWISCIITSGDGYPHLLTLPFHAANVVFHTVAAVALFFVLVRLLRNLKSAACGAIFFAIHPIQTEAVA